MINKLTKFVSIKYGPDGNLEASGTEAFANWEEVKELLANQEKKTKILLDALENIASAGRKESYTYGCSGSHHIGVAKQALDEYKKE